VAIDYRRGFATRLRPYAEKLQRDTGIPASYSLALAANESGWDDTNPNLFRIPGPGPSGSTRQAANPNAYSVGGEVPQPITLAQYSTPEEAFQHLTTTLQSPAFANLDRSNPRAFAQGLQQSGISSDPALADKIDSMVATINSYDQQSGLGPGPPAPQRGQPGFSERAAALAQIEQDQITKIQGQPHLSQTYKGFQQASLRRVIQTQKSMTEVEDQLRVLQTPDVSDLLTSTANTFRTNPAAITSAGSAPATLANLILYWNPQYSQSKIEQITAGQQALALAGAENTKAEFIRYWLESAPGGWHTGDYPEDFQGALNQFATQAASNDPSPEDYKRRVLGSLTPTDLAIMEAAWGDIPNTIPRALTDAEAAPFIEALQTRPKSRIVDTSVLTTEELVRSLTGTAPGPIPQGLDMSRFNAYLARKYQDPDYMQSIDSLRVHWRSLATEWYKQDQMRQARQAGEISPDVRRVSGWEWMALGAVQPFLLPFEALKAYSENVGLPAMASGFAGAYGLPQGSGALVTGGLGAALGFGVAGPPGALVGGTIGGVAGLLSAGIHGGEISARFNEIRRQSPGLYQWQAAVMAWEQAEIGGVLRFTSEVMGDPGNLIGTGLVTKFVKPFPIYKQFAAWERGFASMAHVASYPMATGIVASVATGNPIIGVGAGLAHAGLRAAGVEIPQTLQQLARRSAGEATQLWASLAIRRAGENNPAATLSGTARTSDLLAMGREGIRTIRNNPIQTVQTELHRLGLFIFQTGFTPPFISRVGTRTGAPVHADLSPLIKSLGVQLAPEETKVVLHNITDAIYSNIGRGSFYKRPEIANRIAAALGIDPAVTTKIGDKVLTNNQIIRNWMRRFEKGTFDSGLAPFTRRPTDGAVNPSANPNRALEDFGNKHEESLLNLYRHPSYQMSHSEGIVNHLQRWQDQAARWPVISFMNRMVMSASRHNLFYTFYGPVNVEENAQRMFLGGVNPFPGAPGSQWYATSLDLGHMFHAATGDIPNKQAIIGALSDAFQGSLPVLASLPDNPTQVLIGLNTREGRLPGITRGIPDTLRSGFLQGRGTRAADWIEAHVPKQFYSLAHWGEAWQGVTRRQENYYLYNKWIQSLAGSNPEEFKAILGAVGDINDTPLKDTLTTDVKRSIQQKLNTFALMVDPRTIRAMKMTHADLVNTNITNAFVKVISRYPQLGEMHSRAILHGVQTGEFQLGRNAAETTTNMLSYLERVRLSWWDQSVMGQLEYHSHVADQVRRELLGFHPEHPEDVVSMLTTMDNTLMSMETSTTHIMESMVNRGDELGTAERRQLFSHGLESLTSLTDKLGQTYAAASTRLMDRIRDPAMGYTPAQQDLFSRWLKLFNREVDSIRQARLAEETRHEEVFVKGSGSYTQHRALVREAWDRHHHRHAEIEMEARDITDKLAASFGIPHTPGSIQLPGNGTLTPIDVSRMYNSLPSALIHQMVEPISMTLQSRRAFIEKHLVQAEHLADGLGQKAADFGFTENTLGQVYDNLLRSVSLNPSGETIVRWTKPPGWIRSAHGTPATYGAIDPGTMISGQYGKGFYTTDAPFIGKPGITEGYAMAGLSGARVRVSDLEQELRRVQLAEQGAEFVPGTSRTEDAQARLASARQHLAEVEAQVTPQTRVLDIPENMNFYDVTGGMTHETWDRPTAPPLEEAPPEIGQELGQIGNRLRDIGDQLIDLQDTPGARDQIIALENERQTLYDRARDLNFESAIQRNDPEDIRRGVDDLESFRLEIQAEEIDRMTPNQRQQHSDFLDQLDAKIARGKAALRDLELIPGDFSAPVPAGLLDKAEAQFPGTRDEFEEYLTDLKGQASSGYLHPRESHGLVLPNGEVNEAEAFYRHMERMIHERPNTYKHNLLISAHDLETRLEIAANPAIDISTLDPLEKLTMEQMRVDPSFWQAQLRDLHSQIDNIPPSPTSVNDWLAQQGFEGIKHIGGVNSDLGAHTVRVVFPESIGKTRNSLTNFDKSEVKVGNVDLPSAAMFRGLAGDLVGEMTTAGLPANAHNHLNDFIEQAARNLEDLRDPAGAAVRHTQAAAEHQRNITSLESQVLGGNLPNDTILDLQAQRARAVEARDAATTAAFQQRGKTWDQAAWQQSRRGAMDQANVEYARDFPDYSNQNMFDAVMKGFYPFWIYEKERFPWLLRTAARRPSTLLTWGKYMENTDEGYITVPGTNFQINPLRGGVAMGGFRRLMMRDTPEYYDQFPEAVTGVVDRMSRAGFYPGIHVTAPLAYFGGTNLQSGEIMPPWANTFLGVINTAPIPDATRRTINDQLFPDRFREFRVIQEVGEQTGDGDLGNRIYAKLQARVPLTPAEQSAWNAAEQRVWFVAGTLDSQVGMFRLRGAQKVALHQALKEADSALSGVPLTEMEAIDKAQPVTGKRFSDIYPADPLQQWVRAEYFDKMRGFLRPQTTPLVPSSLGRQQTIIQSYYRDVESVQEALRTQGFRGKDEAGRDVLLAKSTQQLDQEFKAGKLTPDEYRNQLADTYTRAQAAQDAIGQTMQYAGVPKSRKEREDFYREHGILVPTFSPGQELLWEYYQIRPEQRQDEDGILRPDYDQYFQKLDTLVNAMEPGVQQRFLARIQAEWTDTQRLQWQHSKAYLAAYRNIRNVVIQQLPADQQAVINQFRTADTAEKQRLQSAVDARGQPVLAHFNRTMTTFRNNLRMADPNLDAALLFWGKTDKVLSPEAVKVYNQLIAEHRPGAEPIQWRPNSSQQMLTASIP
jgi:flagellar protein FlgJ